MGSVTRRAFINCISRLVDIGTNHGCGVAMSLGICVVVCKAIVTVFAAMLCIALIVTGGGYSF